MRYLESCTLEDLKRATKKLKEEAKSTRNGRQRKFFLSEAYVSSDTVFDFLIEQGKNTIDKIKEERERAWIFLNDESETVKAGWYSKKPQEQKLDEWASKAFPNISVDMFDVQFEQKELEKEFKHREG